MSVAARATTGIHCDRPSTVGARLARGHDAPAHADPVTDQSGGQLWLPPQPAIRTRDALALGITRGQLAGPGWQAPLRGVRLPVGADANDPLQRILAVAEVLPSGAAIGGWAAARLLGAGEFDGRGASGQGLDPVPVILPPPILVRERPEIVRWRSHLGPDDVSVVHGIPCTSPVRTGFDLARRRSLREAVVALDQLGRLLRLSPEAVLHYADERRGWRGVPQVRRAVGLTDPRALSTGETRLRLVWVLDARLPPPEVNADVFDLGGFFLGMADLLDISAGMLGEYDGGGHRAAERHTLDNAREEWLKDSGLIVVRATSIDVGRQRRRTAARLLTAHRRGTGRDRSRDRWTWRARTPATRPPGPAD